MHALKLDGTIYTLCWQKSFGDRDCLVMTRPETHDRIAEIAVHEWTGEVKWITVAASYRRRGIATTLFQLARQRYPNLHHSELLSEDGRKWKESLK